MAKDQRSSIAVSRATAAALKVLADEIGTTVGEMLSVIVTHKPALLQRAYVQGDRLAKTARLLAIGQRRMAASGSGSRPASSAPAAGSAPGQTTPAQVAVQRRPSAPPRTP